MGIAAFQLLLEFTGFISAHIQLFYRMKVTIMSLNEMTVEELSEVNGAWIDLPPYTCASDWNPVCSDWYLGSPHLMHPGPPPWL
jgi:hypothetical protein